VVLVGFLLKRKGFDIQDISFRDAVVIVLASFRMTRILVFEKIFKYLRDEVKRKEDYYVIGTIRFIITCPWCMGVWTTLVIIVFYYLVPYGDLLTYVLALAGVASIVILIANLMHMWTENVQRAYHRNKQSSIGYRPEEDKE